MHHTYRILFPALLFLLSIASTFAADTVTVNTVISGTTFITGTGRTVTLLGLMGLESKTGTSKDGRSALEALIEGQTVVLVADSVAMMVEPATTAVLAYVGDRLINLEMIRQGFAVAAEKPLHSHFVEFKAAEKEARGSRQGTVSTERSTSVQCSAITRKGAQCKRMTTNLSGKCWQHE